MEYFSEREEGAPPREQETIGEVPWGGIYSLIRRYLANGCFGPMSDEGAFWRALRAEVPTLPELFEYGDPPESPPTWVILDVIEFCSCAIEKPIHPEHDDFLGRHHAIKEGQEEFRIAVNRIFRRNGLAYELIPNGRIERLVEPVLREALASADFRSGDGDLDRMLETARQKFRDPDEDTRREALNELWRAWERLKTVGRGSNKAEQVQSLLDDTAGPASPKFRAELERDASALTEIGNQFEIRHSEVTQERLAQGAHVDYVFHRLFAMIQMILRRPS